MKTMEFPSYTGVKCNMMPFIQGDPKSLPLPYKGYSEVIKEHHLQKGEIGYLTIDESWVPGNTSQRGYNSHGARRNVHIEVGRSFSVNCWGGTNTWGKKKNVILRDDVEVLIANSISGTCRYWDMLEMQETPDGDLSNYLERYPVETSVAMQAGEVRRISIFTPHECVPQKESSYRQFFRIVGDGVTGREPYFTVNPLLN